MSRAQSPRIVCLLPVRNEAALLRRWLDEAPAFADAVVALDDGSTDDTAAILGSHPLVKAVLANERRPGRLGWHDGRNRNRLLSAAAALDPDWIISLDADERFDPSDADALRRFICEDALPGCAYGFRLHRMDRDETHDPLYEWVFRLFAFRPGQRFVNRRLDLVPIPTSIGPELWVKTTLRIKHYGEVGEAGREQRIAKFREADPEGAFRSYYENLQAPSSGPYPRWRPREPSTPVLPTDRDHDTGRPKPHVVCLLPARNCASLLPGWFESIALVADAVVALDDGSIDRTRCLLDEHPLVVRLLTNAPRAGFEGWDDGENRNRLLAAAADLTPKWIVSIDADERIPLEDALALRRFLSSDAQPGYAYALQSYRMIGDEDHYDRLDYDAYRVFAWEPGQVFPPDRLHAPPVPTTITRWRQTTLRMKHLVSLTEAHRRARYAKFAQADPHCIWEADYAYTVERPGPVKQWVPRDMARPVLVHPESATGSIDDLDLDGPVLSVVFSVNPGQEHDVAWWLHELAQDLDDTVELIVATRDGYAAEVVDRFVDDVVVVRIEPDWTDAGLRNVALRAARGDYVAFLDLGDQVTPAGLADLIDAHEHGCGVIQLPLADVEVGPAGRASLLLTGGDLDQVSASFIREKLLALGGFDDHAVGGLAQGAADALLAARVKAATVHSVIRSQRPSPTWAELLRRCYQAGRRATVNDARAQASEARLRLRGFAGMPDAPRATVAGLVAAGAAARWLGAVRSRIGRTR